jgi:hypothetical protein
MVTAEDQPCVAVEVWETAPSSCSSCFDPCMTGGVASHTGCGWEGWLQTPHSTQDKRIQGLQIQYVGCCGDFPLDINISLILSKKRKMNLED